MLQMQLLPSRTSPPPFLSIAIPDQSGQLHESYASALLHEIRNPLTNIRLAVEMLHDEIKNSKEKSYLDIINRASSKIEELINNLIKDHLTKIQKPYYSLHELLEEILCINADRLLIKNITVTKNYAATDYQVFGNKHGMLMGLSNIIVNAIEAIQAKKGHIKVLTEHTGDRFVI